MADHKDAVLVLGGAGFIGSHCCVVLAQKYKVVVVDNLVNSSEKAIERISELSGTTIDFHKVDICDEAALDSVVSQYHNPEKGGKTIAAAILLAGLKAVGESVREPLRYYQVNIGGALTIMKVLAKYGCKRLVFSSSATVYGAATEIPIPETAKIGALNPYGRTKLFIEQILQDLFVSDASWRIVILRYFNPCGAHPSGRIGEDPLGVPNNLMPYLAQVAVGKLEKLTVYGNDYKTADGTGIRDYLHVMDLADGHMAALDALLKWSHGACQVYNLGSGNGYSVLEMIHAMNKAVGRELPYVIGPRREGDTDILCADVRLAQEELKWRASRTLDDMCRDLWKWQTMNPNGYRD